MSFDNKVVLVTGASSGIGAATAILFAKEGANVAIVGRNQKKLDAVAAKIADVGKKPLVINADISKDDDTKRIITDTVAEFGKLDVLVNNAGFAVFGRVRHGNIVEAYDTVMRVNLRGTIQLTTLATPHLIATKGNIVNVSSCTSMTTPMLPDFIVYGMSKAALDHFTRGTALELASSGIRVNSVNPGPVKTDFFENMGLDISFESMDHTLPLKRVTDSEEIADLIVYVAGEKARGITGSLFVHDNGLLLQPSLFRSTE
ncbi:enoyl-(Acyl carrier protein) reductase domain-containing protein [Phthorimaea operculella]|nr:enoyl-(Acyl carrier protein) reductase domain-containing protein [Phthorimaea operculella]